MNRRGFDKWRGVICRLLDPAFYSTRQVLLASSLLIFGLAAALRAGYVVERQLHKKLERYELDNIAISLASGRGFANPFPTATGPTAWYSPGYPFVYAAVYRLFGTGEQGELVRLGLNVTVSSAGYALLPWAASSMGLGAQSGVLAGIIGALVPTYVWGETHGGETAFSQLLMALMTVWMLRFWEGGRAPELKSVAALGVAWGAVLLSTASAAAILAGWMIAALAFPPSQDRRGWYRRHVIMLAVAGLCLAPWVVRNWLVFKRFLPLRSNFGLVLWISNNPQAQPTFQTSYERRVHAQYDPMMNTEQRELLRKVGEVEYCRALERRAWQWIRENPDRFAWLTLQRAVFFWFPPHFRLHQAPLLWASTLLAWVGFKRLQRSHAATARLFLTMWIFYPITYYMVHFDLRYRGTISWSLLLAAAYTLLSYKPSQVSPGGAQSPAQTAEQSHRLG